MVSRVEPAKEGQRFATGRPGSAGQRRHGLIVWRAGPQGGQRDRKEWARRLQRRGDQALDGEHLEALGGVETPAEPRLRDERVEHRAPPAQPPPVIDWSRVMVADTFFRSYQVENAVEVSCVSWRPSGVRVSSARTLNR